MEKENDSIIQDLAGVILAVLIVVTMIVMLLGVSLKSVFIEWVSDCTIMERMENDQFVNDEKKPLFKAIVFQNDGITLEVYQENRIYKTTYKETSDSSFEFLTPEGDNVSGNFIDYTIKEEIEEKMFYDFVFGNKFVDSKVKLLIEYNDELERMDHK